MNNDDLEDLAESMKATLNDYESYCAENEFEQAVAFLCDFMHYCKWKGWEYNAVVNASLWYFLREKST